MPSSKELDTEQYCSDIVRDCMKQYGRYVLEDRAVPDVRDGLKPSQRRLLWAMYRLGLLHNKSPAKSSRIVGDTCGKYHPHGDAAAYDTLVNLTGLRYPLAKGDGNFGNKTTLLESSYAAPRYTECRLAKLGSQFFDAIHVADTVPNYDDTDVEPVCLPSPIPTVLINGTDGLAVGLATHIPPHNLGEVLDATIYLLDNPDATVQDLLKFIKGPDYGTGVLTSRRDELVELYELGEGKVRFDSSYHVEETNKGYKLVITGLAPNIRKQKILDTVKELFLKKLIESPVTDESTLKGKGVLSYRDTIAYRDAQVMRDRVLPLFESTVSFRWYCLDLNGKPKRFNLLSVLHEFLTFRRQIETKVLQDRKAKLFRKLGIAVAKYRASLDLDKVAKILRATKSDADAIAQLCSVLDLKYEWQAEALMETTLRTLARHRSDEWKQQTKELKTELRDVKVRLANIDDVVKQQLVKMLEFRDERGTKLRTKAKDFGAASSYWVGVTPDGKVDVALDLPLKSKAAWNYVGFGAVATNMVVVHGTNQAVVANVSYLDKYSAPGTVVGATGSPYCLCVTASGRYVAFALEQRRKQFPVFKDLGDDEIVAVVGFDPTVAATQIMVVMDEGEAQYHDVADIKVTRPNVRPKRFKLDRDQNVVNVVVVSGDDMLVAPDGNELGWPEVLDGDFHVVGTNNLVVLKTNARKTADADETLALLSKELVGLVVPLPVVPAEEAK